MQSHDALPYALSMYTADACLGPHRLRPSIRSVQPRAVSNGPRSNEGLPLPLGTTAKRRMKERWARERETCPQTVLPLSCQVGYLAVYFTILFFRRRCVSPGRRRETRKGWDTSACVSPALRLPSLVIIHLGLSSRVLFIPWLDLQVKSRDPSDDGHREGPPGRHRRLRGNGAAALHGEVPSGLP